MSHNTVPNQLPVIRPLARPEAPEAGAGEAFFDAFADSIAAHLADRLASAAQLESQGHVAHAATPHSTGRAVLCVAEAAELLGISRALAYDLIRRNELPSVRLGRRILVPTIAIEQLLAQVMPTPHISATARPSAP